MGKVVKKKLNGMSWLKKSSLVLLLTILTTALGSVNGAEASVTPLNAWPATPQIVSNAATGTVTGNVTVAAGTNAKRLMLVAVSSEYSAVPGSQTMTVTYGGQTVHQLEQIFTGINTIWLGYCDEIDLDNAVGTQLSVTNSMTAGLLAIYASAAVYDNVNQQSPVTGSSSVSTTAAATATSLVLPAIATAGAVGNTGLSTFINAWNGQIPNTIAGFTAVKYAGTNFNISFNTSSAYTARGTAAITATAPTAAAGAAVAVGLNPDLITGTSIISCSGCHGNPPADGTGRNALPGQFQGSHNKHAGFGTGQYKLVCTKCHTSNTLTTHSNGSINIANPINANTGATYTKGYSFPINNSTTLSGGTCANTSCHSNGTNVSTGTIPPNISIPWGATRVCSSCHGTGVDGRPNYVNNTPKPNTHGNGVDYGIYHQGLDCTICHESVTGTTDAYVVDVTKHNNGSYNVVPTMGYSYVAGGGSTCNATGTGCHGTSPVQWGTSLGCIQCHATAKGTRSAVVGEFTLAWGHKKNIRGAVTDADCIVCHLEGDYTTQKTDSAYHLMLANGNIDLRDPDGAGKTVITNNTSGAFTFTKFALDLTTARTSAITNSVADVITHKFCLKCHDAGGATNPYARAGSTPTANAPFGGGFTALNAAGQFSISNSSRHPVLSGRNKDFPTAAKMAVPYKPTGSRGTSGTRSVGVVMNCFDCHNTPTPLTTRTVTAHGNAATIRGTINVSLPTLCIICHTGYTGSTAGHGTGSAFGVVDSNMSGSKVLDLCSNCHASADTPAPPARAEDVHGVNTVPAAVVAKSGRWGAAGAVPIAFIRNTAKLGNHNPRVVGGTTYTGINLGCNMGCRGTGTMSPYTPGGTY